MKPTDIIKSAYEKKGRQVITIPEWDNMELYFKPMTMKDKDKIFGWHDKSNSDFDLFVYAMIHLCEKEDGSPMFTLEDKVTLMTCAEQDIIERIGRRLFGANKDMVPNS